MTFQHPVPDKLLTLIGDMTVSFTGLEFYMQEIHTSLLNQSARIGHIVASQLSFRGLRGSIITIYKEKHGEDADFATLKDLMKRADKVETERNLITHSFWIGGTTIGSVTRFKVTAREKRGLNAEFKPYNEAILRDFVASIKTLAGEVISFHQNVLANKPGN